MSATSVDSEPVECYPEGLSQGLQVDIIPVSSWQDSSYLQYIDDTTPVDTIYGVTDVDFIWDSYSTSPVDLYGSSTVVNPLGLKFTGYFHAGLSGEYTFNIDAIDDNIAIFIGKDIASSCGCDGFKTSLDKAQIRYSNVIYGSGTSFSVFLVGGYFYPFKMDYYNLDGPLELEISVNDPNGETLSQGDIPFYYNTVPASQQQLQIYRIQLPTITVFWTSTITSTTTTSCSNGEETVVVYKPSNSDEKTLISAIPVSQELVEVLTSTYAAEAAKTPVVSTITDFSDINATSVSGIGTGTGTGSGTTGATSIVSSLYKGEGSQTSNTLTLVLICMFMWILT
ncbi:hypothetical protein PSN45_005180 [Yamadazyma tenuis]|uniref:uncharacterized protein n=1 Tax=Candida tenuis TaxID=2315449 RepID=UPI00279C9D89|nr:hypothetical protein PSN45_005180 [Yamadazyma tenuis]